MHVAAIGLLFGVALTVPAVQDDAGPGAAMAVAMSRAEAMLNANEPQAAESWYREALLEGWLLLGELHRADGDGAEAEAAYERALTSALESRRPLIALAEVALDRGDADGAVQRLQPLVARHRGDGHLVRLLARAYAAAGKPEFAVQELEQAANESPEDLELRFALATGLLRLEQPEEAAVLFEEIARERRIPQTWVLIGRTWRDFGEHDRARQALERAIEQRPDVPRARFHLALVELDRDGLAATGPAIELFQQEERISPDDPVNALYLGMALVAERRFEEALHPLALATRSAPGRLDALLHQGQALLGLDRPAEAADALENAVAHAANRPPESLDATRMERLHYQLALALRRSGRAEEARVHFDAAERYSASSTEGFRNQLASYLEDRQDAVLSGAPAFAGFGTALSGLDPERRRRLALTTATTVARASFNLGVMSTQAQRFDRAADRFAQAAAVAPDLPRVHYSLGVARFNAGEFEQATAPLSRALEETPDDLALKRMLALAWLNAETYDRAAELLADDPGRAADRSLQYAYGLALVRSGRTAQAQPIFDRLLAEHADWPELNVLLGQAAALEGDFDAAQGHLDRAIALRADVAEAHAALAEIHMRRGDLAEAASALRAELSSYPADHRSRYALATVLELDNQPEAALEELDALLAAAPGHANARYLRGKILLEAGRAAEAAAELLAAAELAPEDPNVRNQLGLAFQRLGERGRAEEQFKIFRRLKARSDP